MAQKDKQNQDKGHSSHEMYAAREKIHPREVKGIFQNLRILSVIALLGIYYGLPWLQWGERQAVLFDLPARQFHVFGLTFWPQDFVFLALLLIIAALSLFFFTALAGRLWCGYACPQTVWTELFMWIERWTEGPRQKRIKLDRSPWSREKILRRGSKHLLWILLGLWTGLTFVGYFTPISELTTRAAAFDLGPWETFWSLFYGFATWGNAGFLREQVCIYMCPYARFQSAMFDRNTLIISYDEERGEPRGGRPRGIDPKEKGMGDCIDCNLCVQACPTGIDIRQGLQYECIACAACIDACNQVMDKMEYPRGLIRYTTENALEGNPSRVLRPRVLIYGLLLLILIAGAITGISLRSEVNMEVLADRNVMYREVDFHTVENVYSLRILNKSMEARSFRLEVSGLDDVEVLTRPEVIQLGPGGTDNINARVRVPRDQVSGPGNPIEFTLVAEDDPSVQSRSRARFHGPSPE
ncbi:cytochrome c oxidase accessory protein CcoG [Gammaproteobacteria bacterium AB-CW1]|uniref:Cytochrome c oxidase accessory protein CcoG n=1 Tax=Natronospira elongata TaxID=3110268 RepID=A0AAP6MMH5_9GAMM|nr:cytochrome c oxidase accessory protein CcoG [Gammaproteobacteria bacterium AB-CW1]